MSLNLPGSAAVNAAAALLYQQSDLFKTVNLAATRADSAAAASSMPALAALSTVEKVNGAGSDLDDGGPLPLPTPFAQHQPGSTSSAGGTASQPGQPLANGNLKQIQCHEQEETIASLSAKVLLPAFLSCVGGRSH